MNEVEYRARTAMRAIAWTVSDAPPLRLPRRHAGAPAPRRRLWMWLAPLAAAAAVIAIAIALVAVRGSAGRPPVRPVTPAPATTPPRYYVALNQQAFDWPSSLVVGDTYTGAKVATVAPPPGSTFGGVTGAADDRTFVVDSFAGSPGDESAPFQPRTWYLLRIAPGSAHPARLTRLPIPVTQAGTDVDAIALSPDGGTLAVAMQPDALDNPRAPAYLRLYSTATGAMIRSWSTSNASVFAGPKYGGPDSNTLISWRADGRAVSFGSSWVTGVPAPVNGSDVQPTPAQRRNIRDYATIRTLDIASPGGDLIADSRLAWSRVSYPDRASAALTCTLTARELLVSADGNSVVCGATALLRNPGPPRTACPAIPPWRAAGFLRYSTATGGLVSVLADITTNCRAANEPVDALWVNATGGLVIGYIDRGGPGARFGVFTRGKFTPLPALLTGGDNLPTGEVAW